MTTQRWFVLTAFITAACVLTGLGALAAGAAFRSGTNTEAEREVALVACVLGFLSGGLLLALSTLRADVLGRTAAAGAFIAALAFAVPAVLAFAATVNTPTDDSFGCGSISTPNKTLVVRGARPKVTPSCQERLTKQKLLVFVLALPTIGAASSGLLTGLRPEARQGEQDA
jgi:hypothetical protein